MYRITSKKLCTEDQAENIWPVFISGLLLAAAQSALWKVDRLKRLYDDQKASELHHPINADLLVVTD